MFCSASPVLKHTQDDVSQRGIFGTLLCTNFRVSFISDETPLEETVWMKDRASMTYCSLHAVVHLKEAFHHMINIVLMLVVVGLILVLMVVFVFMIVVVMVVGLLVFFGCCCWCCLTLLMFVAGRC